MCIAYLLGQDLEVMRETEREDNDQGVPREEEETTIDTAERIRGVTIDTEKRHLLE